MKKFSCTSLFFSCLLALVMSSCIKPEENTPPPPPEDPFINYTRVEASLKSFPELGEFYCQEHFLIDSSIYVFSNKEMAVFNLSGDLQSVKSFYSSNYAWHINSIKYDGENKLFFFAGSVDNDPYYSGFANPLLFVTDLQGNLVFEKSYAWNGRQNFFSDILLSAQKDPVILTYDLVPLPSWGYKDVNTLLFLNNSYDSVGSVEIPFDSCSYSYFDYLNDSAFKLVGEKTDSVVYSVSHTHMIYAEMSLSGDPVKMTDICPGDGDHFIENSSPLGIYHWTKNDTWELFSITLNKFSETGALNLSKEVELLRRTAIHPVTEVYAAPGNESILVYGLMMTLDYYVPPEFYGDYILKMDASGNEEYRILFNDELHGIPQSGPCMIVLGDNHYMFLFSFYDSDSKTFSFCTSEVKVE